MSGFAQKRIDFINTWPNSVLFDAEQNYKQRCDTFTQENGKLPFAPLHMWNPNDDTFNRAISHLIDSLEMMPLKPNFAFTFVFSGLDYYAKAQYSSNTTCSLKSLVEDILSLSVVNNDVKTVLAELYSVFPINAALYLYKCLCSQSNHNSNVRKRVTTDKANAPIAAHEHIVDAIYNQYGYNSSQYNESIRQAAMLYRKVFMNDNLTIGGNSEVISDSFRLYLLILGFVYSLRNDAMHGSGMSSTKSSKTSPERYALNYYAFLSTYTIFIFLLIMKSSLTDAEKNQKYEELRLNTVDNIDCMKKLFGSHI